MLNMISDSLDCSKAWIGNEEWCKVDLETSGARIESALEGREAATTTYHHNSISFVRSKSDELKDVIWDIAGNVVYSSCRRM